ncbi:MAG: NUDIX hydrolase [Clostridia bacterium]|nr:NUDIX hydrolase [Clostridia bacterium]
MNPLLNNFRPCNPQEAADLPRFLELLETAPDAFERERAAGHFTASAWITDPAGERVVFVYHRIYDSWSWVGGHADGETDLAAVALREAKEETGLRDLNLLSPGVFSIELLPVAAHTRRGVYVPAHLHYNVTYLFSADPDEKLTVNEAENSGVRWFLFDDAFAASSEKQMVDAVYKKLAEKTRAFFR